MRGATGSASIADDAAEALLMVLLTREGGRGSVRGSADEESDARRTSNTRYAANGASR